MRNPSPGSWRGGFGLAGEGTVPMGAALPTTRRRAPAAFIAAAMARVPCVAIPASAFDRGPRPESTASAPSTADLSVAGFGAARSAVTTRTCLGELTGQFLGVADDRGDVMARADGLLEDLPADAAGRCEDREFPLALHGVARGSVQFWKAVAWMAAQWAKVSASRPSTCCTASEDGPGRSA